MVQTVSIPFQFHNAFHWRSLCATIFFKFQMAFSLCCHLCASSEHVGSRVRAPSVHIWDNTIYCQGDCWSQTVTARYVSDTGLGERCQPPHLWFSGAILRTQDKKRKEGHGFIPAIKPILSSLTILVLLSLFLSPLFPAVHPV